MRKTGLFLIFIVLLTTLIISQTYKGKAKVIGYVFDAEGNPIEGVKVKLHSLKAQSGFETETDSKGKWKAIWIIGGQWDIDFEKIGYAPKKISCSFSEYNKNPDVEVTLRKLEGMVFSEELKEELKRGNALFNEEKYEEAIEAYRVIIEKFPDAYIVYQNIGNCYFQMEEYGLAEEYYRKILEKDSHNQEAMLLIGNSHANRGETDKALEWYQKIEFDKIDDPMVLYNIGSNFYSQSKYDEALKYYKKAVEIQNDFLDAIYQLGLAHLTLGNYKDSIDVFRKYLENDPDSERASQVNGFIDFLRTKIEE